MKQQSCEWTLLCDTELQGRTISTSFVHIPCSNYIVYIHKT